MKVLNNIVFYTLEKSIKTYRQFAQKNINAKGFNLTIDQWLVLKTLQEDPAINQKQIAAKVFKDVASVTRIIELLVKNGYLLRDFYKEDRRRFELTLSKAGAEIITALEPVINSNRNKALKGLSTKDIENLQLTLTKITANINCH